VQQPGSFSISSNIEAEHPIARRIHENCERVVE
jgi:hypothetical protein